MAKFIDILVISGSVLGLLMGLSILSSSFFRSKANNYLACFILLLTLVLFLGWLDAGIGFWELMRMIMWELLIPVMVLSYFLTHLKHPFVQSKRYKYLYVPFLFSIVIDVVFGLDFFMQLYNLPFSIADLWVQLIYLFFTMLAIVFNGIVVVWTRRLILKSHESIQIKRWLLRLNLGLLIIVGVWFIDFMSAFLPIGFLYYTDVVWGLIVIMLWFVMYFGVFNLQIAIEQKEIGEKINTQKNRVNATDKNEKYKGKPIAPQSTIVSQFIGLLEEKEWYKKQLLSRLELANELGISEGYLSQIINQELGKSVVQIINEYRIGETKRLFLNPGFKQYSVLAIGMEAGFKSKSVFYEAFKANTGVSPGVYRKRNEQ